MPFPKFEFQSTQFNYKQSGSADTPSTITVNFFPLGGQDFGVQVMLDGDEIDRYRHSGSFTSTDAAQYCLAGITTYIKEGRTILSGNPNAPIITLKPKGDD